MKFIKLTTSQNKTIFINPDHIIYIGTSDSGHTYVVANTNIWVKETPEEIMEMIKEEK